MQVSIRNLTKCFGSTPVLRNVSLEVADRELFFLLGPSGCGKTTLLRLIAGFHRPDDGDVYFADRPMSAVPPHRRNTGLVFQNYALWPHLTVAQNVGYGLEVRGATAEDRERRVTEALDIVQMTHLATRMPTQLSGGQQQRVALARALVIRPDVLLLDEPLSNLDARLRLGMREEILRIHRQTQITTIYVTHDQKEALSMADRIAVLRDGVVEQVGSPKEVYRAPATRFVADFVGETNWLPAMVTGIAAGEMLVQTDLGGLTAPYRPGLKPHQAVWVGFRPEAVRIGSKSPNGLEATISQVSYLGESEQYLLTLPPTVTIKASEQNPTEIRAAGSTLSIHLPPDSLIVLPRDVGASAGSADPI